MTALVQYRDRATDNSRWDHFTHRPGDIILATPAKCGTTWTQTIIASLLFPRGDYPGPVMVISPWLDGRMFPLDQTLARLEDQQHRRFIKTHTPGDGVPFWADARYVVVYRDGRDAFMSMLNHEDNMRPEMVARMNELARASGGAEIDNTADPHDRYQRWLGARDNALRHLATWWPRRHEPNVLFIHYNDLKTDLDGEMRRIAAYIDVDVDESLWPDVVRRCTFEAMKERSEKIAPFDLMFDRGVDAFLFKGTNGRWHDFLTADELQQYDAAVVDTLDPDAARWLEHGSIAGGMRPET